MDRVRISEFFALICTGLMLLTLFLLSATHEPDSISHAGLGPTSPSAMPKARNKNIEGDPLPAPASIEVPKQMRIPVRTIDRIE